MEDVSTLGACLEKMGAFRPFLLLYENGLLSVLKRKEKDDLYSSMGNGTEPSHPNRPLGHRLNSIDLRKPIKPERNL